MTKMILKSRVAVLTGAGSGLGRAMALALARRGCNLALADVNEAGLMQTAEAAEAMGVRVSRHRLDVADRQAVAALPTAVLAAHGQVDLLINNAGVALGGSFEELSEVDFDWLMEINFHGLVRMTRAFLPVLRKAPGESRIVNVSSLFGLVAPAGQSAYSASKFAVRGFSNALRHELLGSSVGVTVAHPGGVATAIASSARIAQGLSADAQQERRDRANKLLRMSPDRAAEIIVQALEKRRARVLVGADAKTVSLLERVAPVHYWWLLGRLVQP